MNEKLSWQTNFGPRLRAERERKGLTRLALANLANTKQNFIAEIERGDRYPSLRTFMNILNVLDISADSILFGVKENESDDFEVIINEFTDFLRRREPEVVKGLYEIVRVASKYVVSGDVH